MPVPHEKPILTGAAVAELFVPTGMYARWHKEVSDAMTVWACGYAHHGHDLYCGDALARMAAERLRGALQEEWGDFFRRLNGSWALVVLQGTVVYAVVDRTRSYPLLYTEAAGSLRVSDSIARMCIGPVRWCPEAVQDFLWAGYPTGTATLVMGVYQVPAGMYLRYDLATNHESLVGYFDFLPTEDTRDNEDEMATHLSELLDEATLRIHRVPHGRIVVPLSGGMDSRVIVALLKKHGFEDVLCFTYGYKRNPESEASKMVAEALGYEWHFVEYSPATWASRMFSQEMKAYQRFAANGCSLPSCTNWPAVKALCERGQVSAGATFLPGHTGILVRCHLPDHLSVGREAITLRHLAEHIVRVHFCYWMRNPPQSIGSRFIEQFCAQADRELHSSVEADRLYGRWYWRERQAKFIVNSDRVYEYFGCRWLTPLWDVPLIDYYLTLPKSVRHGKRLFLRAAVDHVFTGARSVLADIPLAVRGSLSPRQVLSCARPGCSWREGLSRLLQKVKWKLSRGRIIPFPHYALLWEHSFADNRNPRRQTVRQVFERHGMGDVFDSPECESILPFADVPVAYLNPFGLMTLSAFANMRQAIEPTRRFN